MVSREGVRERSQQRPQSLRLTAIHQTPLASQKHRRHRLLPRQQCRLRPMVGRGRGREQTQRRHQPLRQTAAQRRPLTSKIRLQGLPLPRHQRLRPRAGGLGAAG
ncbi:unnamed protein product [Pylaiella littoralis]